jgi:hypothetical protein
MGRKTTARRARRSIAKGSLSFVVRDRDGFNMRE